MEKGESTFKALEKIRQASYMCTEEYQNAEGELVFPIGKTEKGDILVQDFNDIPHMFICGTVGSGKTSFIQTMVTCLISRYSPEQVRFVIYDSKTSDYYPFANLPYMLLPIITDQQRAIAALRWMCGESSRRRKNFAVQGCRDIHSYNRKQEKKGEDALPNLFLIFDDNSVDPVDAELINALSELVRNGRIAGIHVIVSTSMMTSKLVKTELLPYILCRVIFRVASKRESILALDSSGAEKLRIPNEMIFKYRGDPVKCEAVYIPFEDIRQYLATIPKYTELYSEAAEFVEKEMKRARIAARSETEEDDGVDLLFEEAVEVILDQNQASTSMLQRKLRVGYAQAARIMDELEDAGIIGPQRGSVPRQILITKQQWLERVIVNEGKDSQQETKERDTPSGNPLQSHAPLTTGNNNETAVQQSASSVQTGWDNSQELSSGQAIPRTTKDFTFVIETERFKPLHAVPDFQVSNMFFSVKNNQVEITELIQNNTGIYKRSTHFFGNQLIGLTYRKATLFSKGFLRFILKSNEVNEFDIPLQGDEPQGKKIDAPFGLFDAGKMRDFAESLASDLKLKIRTD